VKLQLLRTLCPDRDIGNKKCCELNADMLRPNVQRGMVNIAHFGSKCARMGEVDGVSSGAMLRPATIRAEVRRRGNPYWGKPLPLGPGVPTEFELQVKTLRLTPETYIFSAELHRWCWRNRNRHYIPEWLLEESHITVDPNITDAA